MLNNFMFKESEVYSFEEVASYLIDQTSSGSFPPFEQFGLKELLLSLPIIVDGENVYGVSYVELSGLEYQFTSMAMTCLNKIYLRYKDHYCVNVEEQVDRPKLFKAFFIKLLNLLDYTYPKYTKMLSLYEAQKDNLLNKLGRTRSGNRSMSQTGQNAENSVHIYNDSPQTSDVVATLEQDQFVSELNKNSVAGSSASSGSDTFQEADEWDNATIMARLNEIEQQFSLVWKNWLNEFDQLFVEEVNY